MINDENKTKIIDEYLAGTLDDDLRQEVEERIKSDAAFRREVALQDKIIQTVRNQERQAMRNKLEATYQQTAGKETAVSQEADVKPLSNRRNYYAIAATIALLIAAGILFFLYRQSAEPNFGYVAVQLPDGSRGDLPATVPDSLPLLIMPGDEAYPFHYRFGDTLALYGDFSLESLQVTYEPNREAWTLGISGQTYAIPKTGTIRPLTP